MPHTEDYTRIWADKENNIGLSFSEISRALGVGSRKLSTLCLSAQINKWAKNKPIRFDSRNELTDEQRKGNPTDINNGIIYGIKFTETHAGNFHALHGITFAYVGRPNGSDTEPFRTLDFNNYSSVASPTLNGSVNFVDEGEAHYDVNTQLFFSINRDANQYGVDVADVVQRMSGVSLENTYPCIVVSEYNQLTTGYICALKSQVSGEQDAVRPLYYNGQWITRFYADFNLLAADFPASLRDKPLFATLFLIPKMGAGQTFPLTGKWVNESGRAFSERGIPLPKAIKIPMTVTEWDNSPVATPVSYYYNRVAQTITIRFSYNTPKQNTVYLRTTATPTGGTRLPVIKETVDRMEPPYISPEPVFSLSEFGSPVGSITLDVVISTGRQSGTYPHSSQTVRFAITL